MAATWTKAFFPAFAEEPNLEGAYRIRAGLRGLRDQPNELTVVFPRLTDGLEQPPQKHEQSGHAAKYLDHYGPGAGRKTELNRPAEIQLDCRYGPPRNANC